MKHKNDINAMVGLWESRQDFSVNIGVSIEVVHKWIANNSIPSRYWRVILDAAAARGIQLSADQLIEWHSRAA